MKYLIKIIFLIPFLVLISLGQLAAQITPETPAPETQDTTEQKPVIVDHSDIGEYIQEEGRQIQMLMKVDRQVELRQGDAFMYCDTAIIEENDVVAYGNVIIQQGDSLNVFADSLVYLGNERIADLYRGVVLENGEQRLFTEVLKYNLDTKVATYFTGAMLTNEETQLTSKRGYYYVNEKEAFFKDSVVVINDEFTLQADTLKYDTETKVATFLGPSLIRQDSAKIYCEAGFYDTANKRAEFTKNAQYLKGEQEATALVIRYEGADDQVILEGDARFKEGEKDATADVIRYDDKQDLIFLEGNAVYKDETQFIEADKIEYDSKSESVKTDGRSRIVDETQILIADQIDYDNNSQLGIATGNVFWVDTVEQITISCENAEYDRATDYLKATGGRPLMTTLINGDTLYLVADTLISYRPSAVMDTIVQELDSLQLQIDSVQLQKDTLGGDVSILPPIDSIVIKPLPMDTLALDSIGMDSLLVDSLLVDTLVQAPDPDARNLIANRNVIVYKSNMQAVCDSLTYSTADSLFQFFKDPIIWSDTSQFYADVIHMKLANNKIDRILLYENSFIVNSPDEVFFNQIKGRDIIAFFEEDEIRRVRVDGNAESVYYALDDDRAYVAVNKTVCSEMMLFFGNNEIEQINFYRQPQATMHPMNQIDHETLELPGFYWETKKRPSSVADLRKVVPEEKPENTPAEKGEEEELPEEKEIELGQVQEGIQEKVLQGIELSKEGKKKLEEGVEVERVPEEIKKNIVKEVEKIEEEN